MMFKGDYDPRKTKVLHMPINPASVAVGRREKQLETLKKTNTELEEKVQYWQIGHAINKRIIQAANQKPNQLPVQKLTQRHALLMKCIPPS